MDAEKEQSSALQPDAGLTGGLVPVNETVQHSV